MVTIGRLNINLLASAQQFNKEMKAALKTFQNVGKKMQRTGKNLSRNVSAPIVALGGFAIKMASDSAEAATKFEAVFGGATQDVNKWVGELRDTIPATTDTIQGMASGIQDLLVPLGIAPGEAAEMTKSVVQLAGDLASFNNIPVEQALEKIRSGLVGQNEPLLSFGVAIDAAAVKLRAYELGLYAGEGAITANARAQAAFSLIQENTTAAHGDAARTAESTANQFRFLKAELQEVAAVVGAQLLPVITPIVAKLAAWLKQLGAVNPEIIRMGLVIGGLAAVLGPIILTFGLLLAAINPITIVLAGTAGLIALVVWLSTKFEWLGNIVQKVTGFFKDLVFGQEEVSEAAKRAAASVRTEAVEFEGTATAVQAATQATGAYSAQVRNETIPVNVRLAQELRGLREAYAGVRAQIEPLATGELPALNRAFRFPELVPLTMRTQDFRGAIQSASDTSGSFRDVLGSMQGAVGALGGAFGNVTGELGDFVSGVTSAFASGGPIAAAVAVMIGIANFLNGGESATAIQLRRQIETGEYDPDNPAGSYDPEAGRGQTAGQQSAGAPQGSRETTVNVNLNTDALDTEFGLASSRTGRVVDGEAGS